MHISEGVLSLPVLAIGYAVSAVGIGVGLKKLKDKDLVRTAIFSSAFFVASLVHVPFGPVSVHLVLNGLLGILLGWSCFCAIFIALLLQAIIFQFGGITTLGINTLNMALPALLCYFIFSPVIKKKDFPVIIPGFLCGFLAVFLSTLAVSFSLVFTGEQFIPSAKLIMAGHVPVMFIDGIITGVVLQFIKKVKPEML